jgi:DNA-damage-inducible protein J
MFAYDMLGYVLEVVAMANALVQFRTDETEKEKAVSILDQLGLDLPSYLRMCISRLVSDRGIPFSMKLDDDPTNRGVEAMKRASQIAEESGISNMSLEEINAEIAAVRK